MFFMIVIAIFTIRAVNVFIVKSSFDTNAKNMEHYNRVYMNNT